MRDGIEAIRTILIADANVLNLVEAKRIVAGTGLNSRLGYPRIVIFELANTQMFQTMDEIVFQLTCAVNTKIDNAEEIADAVETALKDKRPVANRTFRFGRVRRTPIKSDHESAVHLDYEIVVFRDI